MPTTDATIDAFRAATEAWGLPDQLLSDHGSIYWSNPYDGVERGPSRFTTCVEGMGVDHIVSRVGRPQGNGKVERAFQTLEKIYPRFDDLDAACGWYNARWPHMSLGGTAPLQAFYWKLPPERILGLADPWFREVSLYGN